MPLLLHILEQFLLDDISQIVLCYSSDYTWERKQVFNELQYLFRKGAALGRQSIAGYVEECIKRNKIYKDAVSRDAASMYLYKESCAPCIFKRWINFTGYDVEWVNNVSRMIFTYECENPLFKDPRHTLKSLSNGRSKFNWQNVNFPSDHLCIFPRPLDML